MINEITTKFQVLLVFFCILGTITLVASVIYIFSMFHSLKSRKYKYIMSNNTISSFSRKKLFDETASQLSTKNEPRIQASAFVKLMRHGFILLHILQNKGNCYNDNKQPEKYNNFLTPDCINVLFNLEGENAGY